MINKMNVLSLFDGMSCGQIALEKVGIEVDNYFASEINKYAISIAQKNYPDMTHIGDVTKVHYSDFRKCLVVEKDSGYIQDVPKSRKIDLLIGGSPCQGFSFAGKKLNFNDPRSALFFEFVRLLKETKPKYFMLENVRMSQDSQDVISEYLGVNPTMINSALLSAQNRNRLYWTNIPFEMPSNDKDIRLKDILEPDAIEPMLSNIYGGFKEKKPRVHTGKSVTIRSATGGGHIPSVTLAENHLLHRKVTPLECERLQTVPDNYTDGVSNTQRYNMIGNGWTVDVIAHIFMGMRHDNKTQ